MGSMNETTTWTVRGIRLGRLVAALGRTWWEARRHAGALGGEGRRRAIERSGTRMLDAVGVEVHVRGARPLLAGPVLLVANHVSWIDVQALGAVAGARFVAKSEVRDWPLVGALAARLGTIFLRRGHRRDAMRVKNLLARLLVTGERVVVFPEGTTTDGTRVAPFYAALLQAAVDAAIPVQPVAIQHRERDGTRSDAAAFVDDMSFLRSLGRVLERPGIVTEIVFGPPIWAADKTRRDLAARCRGFITAELGCADQTTVPRPATAIRRAA
jgi:1-acyl-sn-glycerol-3-phosphate acyltransferase